jgi:arginine/lysine/ornithine decarboxylase
MSAQDKFDQEYLDDLINEIERIRKERDEARQLYCERMSEISRQQDCTAQWFAEEMNWDCFKDASDDR